ncbi:uncharacterized protein [Physcomitrium patens]|uniref:uncharacterized protein isoform X2 n=1 Tax=Physcomitrium patens TaxID=3218 RepID=UPI003CCDA7E7
MTNCYCRCKCPPSRRSGGFQGRKGCAHIPSFVATQVVCFHFGMPRDLEHGVSSGYFSGNAGQLK